jgi:putative phage-type endonuclease
MGLEIIQINKDKAYDEWIQFRTRGLGASEVGTLMGVNSWKSPAELYYQKIGLIPQKVEPNIPMFMGTILEKTVAEIFEYWDGDDASMLKNYEEGTKVRTLYEPVGYVVNPDYPHLFFSPDRLQIKSKNLRIRDGRINLENVEAIIEIKTISGWSSKQWEGGIPPSYYLQLQTYLMGLALDTGYLVALEDGRNLKVHKFDRDEEMVNMIARMTSEFWTRVEAGRLALELGEDYEQYAPPPDGTEAYAEFLNKKFANPEENTIVSTPEIDEFILQYKVKNSEIGILEDEKREAANFIKEYMGNNTTIQSEEGKVTWRPNAKGVRIFRVG